MANRPLPSQEALLNLFSYDPLTGQITWLARKPSQFLAGNTSAEANCKGWNKKYAGTPAGMKGDAGYFSVHVGNGEVFRTHRVIWKMMTGTEPDTIDHINGRPDDNRWENIRSVPLDENCRNSAKRHDNTSGSAGVFFCPHLKKKPWRARLSVGKSHKNLGYFVTFEDAFAARETEKLRHGFTRRHGTEE